MNMMVHFCTMQAIDAVDNGVNQFNTEVLPKYVDSTHLSERVGRLNPDWTEVNTPEKENDCFDQAMELAGQEFVDVSNLLCFLCTGHHYKAFFSSFFFGAYY